MGKKKSHAQAVGKGARAKAAGTKSTSAKEPRKTTIRVAASDDALLKKLQRLTEHELTEQVLLPLFAKLGYDKVDYHGGPYEAGRDLICWGHTEIGDRKVAVAQVKRCPISARSKGSQSFAEVVNQLAQATEKEIPDVDGTTFLPSDAYFITPFCVTTRALETRIEAYQVLRSCRATVIDGTRLCGLVRKHLPDLAAKLSGDVIQLLGSVDQRLSNETLLNALGMAGRRDVCAIFTDIDVGVGRATTRLLLSCEFRPKRVGLEVSESEWKALKSVSSEVTDAFGVSLLRESFSAVERRFAGQYHEYDTQMRLHRAVTKERDEAYERLQSLESRLRVMCGRLQDLRIGREKLQAQDRECRRLRDERDALTEEMAKLNRMINAVSRKTTADLTGKEKHDLERLRGKITADFDGNPKDLSEDEGRRLQLHALAVQRRVAFERRDELTGQLGNAGQHAIQLIRSCHVGDLQDLLDKIRDFRNQALQPHEDAPTDVKDATEARAQKDRMSQWLDNRAKIFEEMDRDLEHSARTISRLATQYLEVVGEFARLETKTRALPRLEEPKYCATVEGEALAQAFRQARDRIARGAKTLNKRHTEQSVKRFLEKCEGSLRHAAVILANRHVQVAVGVDRNSRVRVAYDRYRLTIPTLHVFSTRMNLALLGEAGAGKTTSLQVYARERLSEAAMGSLTLFVPLGVMVKLWLAETRVFPTRARAPELELGIAAYVRSLGIPITTDELRDALRTCRDSAVLLDGVDEAIKPAPWLLESIAAFAERFPHVQIITSSRTGEQYLDRIPFLGITLLPFTDRQRDQFVSRWFADGKRHHVQRIRTHLQKNQDLGSVVRSPLLATVLCTLAEHGLTLPHNEIALYDERIKLLLGRYDAFRGLQRLESREEDLEALCLKLAFELHSRGTRYEDRSVVDKLALAHFAPRLERDQSLQVLNELIFPCNVLVPMTEDGKLGFGHLRYQEHLAARQIWRNRAIDIRRFLQEPWWRGVFVLLAQIWDDLGWLFEVVASENLGKFSRETVRAMIARRPEGEQGTLRKQFSGIIAEQTRESALEPD